MPPTGQVQRPVQSKPEQAKKIGSAAPETRNIPVRGGQKVTPAPVPSKPKEEDKTVEFFRHLNRPRKTAISEAGKEVHQAVVTVGLQIANYTICGSCARLVATLQAFKEVSGETHVDLQTSN